MRVCLPEEASACLPVPRERWPCFGVLEFDASRYERALSRVPVVTAGGCVVVFAPEAVTGVSARLRMWWCGVRKASCCRSCGVVCAL